MPRILLATRHVFIYLRFAPLLSLMSFGLVAPAQSSASPPDQTNDQTEIVVVKEGLDFATTVLADPWDMSEFTDVSQFFNHAGHENDLVDFGVSDGVFSARTTGDYSELFFLYPGYEPGMINGKIGARLPIDTRQFGCFYVNMSVDVPASPYYYFTVMWAKDRSINWGNSPWGQTYGNILMPNTWKLYGINLHDWVYEDPPQNRWDSQPEWQGLRLTPVLKRPNAVFLIDWVRLTDCTPVYHAITELPKGTYDLWVGSGSPERQILAVEKFSPDASGSYAWDVQGLAPGWYNVTIKTTGTNPSIVKTFQLKVVAAPVIQVLRPSATSGQDYSTSKKEPWDMDPSDVSSVLCADEGYSDEHLLLDTKPPSQLSDGCVGDGANEADPRVFMNIPQSGDLSSYRYLSFAMQMDGAWSVPEEGMILRMIWKLDRDTKDCHYVSKGIALDVGHHTYWVDLYDPWNGAAEEKTPGSCPSETWSGQDRVGDLIEIRIDPNENITQNWFHQEIDWIRLTRIDTAVQGSVFPITILLNKPLTELKTIDFFYTDNPSNPTQHLAGSYTATISQAETGQYRAYLPMTRTSGSNGLPGYPFTYHWNTSGVPAGEYFICTRTDDGYQQTTYCSQAPVQIISQ